MSETQYRCRMCGLIVADFEAAMTYHGPCVKTPGLKHPWEEIFEGTLDDGRGDSPWLMFDHLRVGEQFVITDWQHGTWYYGATFVKTAAWSPDPEQVNARILTGGRAGENARLRPGTEVVRAK